MAEQEYDIIIVGSGAGGGETTGAAGSDAGGGATNGTVFPNGAFAARARVKLSNMQRGSGQ